MDNLYNLCTSRLEHSTWFTGIAEGHRPLCVLKRGAWWAARLCSSILLILSSAERLVSVGDGMTMEVISLISGSIVACHIINVHLWKKKPWPLPCCFCIALSFSLCWIFSHLSVILSPHAAFAISVLYSRCQTQNHTEKTNKTTAHQRKFNLRSQRHHQDQFLIV